MKAILLNRILLVLAFAGLFIAGALSIEAATHAAVPCGPSAGCATVAAHPSSKWGGIPVAYFGLAGYLALAMLAIMRSVQGVMRNRLLITLGFAISGVGALVSLFLQALSFFVINATCLWCLSSAIVMFATLVVHALLAQESDPTERLTNASAEDTASVPAGVAPSNDLPLIGALPLLVGIGLVIVNANMTAAAIPNRPTGDASKVNFVPTGAHIYGEPSAPVTVVEFADLLCPACQRTSPLVKEFISQNPGKIRLVYRHYPLVQLHPQANAAAAISEVASDQGKFWDFALAVMGKQMKPESPDELFETAKSVGVDTRQVRDRLTNEADPLYDRIDRDLKDVKTLGVNSTPTFYVLVKGSVVDIVGPGQILDRLKQNDVQAAMNEAGSGSSSSPVGAATH